MLQDALCGKGFGTDLPLVNSQVEEHNIFHNEVMAIGPHVTKEGTKVSSAAPCWGRGGTGSSQTWPRLRGCPAFLLTSELSILHQP